ncbi:FAD-dependent 5-carboxymethylaminomethyl-2-thiouridine(34) oxidoreductase MnmC [Alkanindiges illinoisensis]|uniref:FAD-dependent 5-carboxymethylaminomethyl-2-thiouridine(34) oxidoreductase MnmC n=1 Tax=Alkanindiges illinoisensis TaxID=197183 RepID=UPI000AE855DE|nr:FAD-dependent 5-carboxymethylaminomethyl-2-thiouridine(34) oxidoreductase MnmC [Alkanindiges illinoisensis]
MSSSLTAPILHAELDWIIQDGVEIPASKQFGDVYFSKANGLAETRHVFLQGNELAERLAQLQSHQYFCVGETGFGTGLNILALWQLWQQYRPNNHSRLHVITVEKFPLSRDDLQRALKAWPELAHLSTQLIAQYPPALPGCHRLVFAGERFSIDLWLGDAADCLPEIQTSHPVDAWFMDGFAPKCNPELWQDNILKHLIRLSGPGTTFASFSVAGVVKQGLRQFGIKVTRPAGFGRKREMLKAWWLLPEDEAVTTTASVQAPPKIAIIGAGIAGLSMAHALASRGYTCDLYDQEQPLAGASGNPRALLAPKLISLTKFSGNLLNLGCLFSLRYWQQFSGVVEKTGTLHILDKRAEQELDKASAYHQDILEGLAPSQVIGQPSQTDSGSALPGIWFKQAGLLNPHRLAQVILQNSAIQQHQVEISQIKALDIPSQNAQWQLINNKHESSGIYDHVVICTALASPQLCNLLPQLKPIRGQVSWFSKPGKMPDLPLPMTYGGYIAQLNQPEHEATVLLGASFIRQDNQTDIRLADHQHNLDLIKAIAPATADSFPPISTWQGRAAIRAQSPDYLPLAGQINGHAGLWTLTGLGSKGFSFAPLCAELICAQLLGEVWPISASVAASVDPNRFAQTRRQNGIE